MQVGYVVAVAWARVGCGTVVMGSQSGSVCPYNYDSLEHIPISLLYERLGFFREHEISFGDQLDGGGSLWCLFGYFWGI